MSNLFLFVFCLARHVTDGIIMRQLHSALVARTFRVVRGAAVGDAWIVLIAKAELRIGRRAHGQRVQPCAARAYALRAAHARDAFDVKRLQRGASR